MKKESHKSKHWQRLLWVIPAVITLAVHLAFVFETKNNDSFRFPLIDAATYHRQAAGAAAGHPLAPGPFWQPPLYPFALSLVYRAAGQGMLTVRILQALLSALTSILTYLAARHILSRPLAILASSLVGIYGPFLFFSSQLLPTGAAATFNIGAMATCLSWLKKPHWGKALGAGILIGLGALTVPNILFVLPAVLILVFVMHRQTQTSGTGRTIACLLMGTAITILPVTVRNWLVSGQCVPISTNGGINLYIGNNPDRAKTIAIRPGIEWDRFASTPLREGVARTPAESQQYFVRKTLRYIRTQPSAFLAGIGIKVRHMLSGPEIPRNTDLYAFRQESIILKLLTWRLGPFGFPFGIMGPLAIIGAFLMMRHGTRSLLPAVWILLYLASVVLFFPAGRYLIPIVPCMLIAAVVAGRDAISGLTHTTCRDVKPAALALCLMVIFAIPVTVPTAEIDFESERLLYTGIALQVRGEKEAALAQYEAAIENGPLIADTWFHRGTLLREIGKPTEAMASHLKALQLNPEHTRAMNDLAVLLFNSKKTEEAVTLLRRSIELDPINRQTINNLAIGLLAQGKIDEANLWRIKAGQMPVKDVVYDGKAKR
ncbi:MAG: glycosyltransferase family 39 protein [Kiritimatiellae bacterium]|nr:glycosyltransferase family 39 protein [Kiritimatiellia bacterium]